MIIQTGACGNGGFSSSIFFQIQKNKKKRYFSSRAFFLFQFYFEKMIKTHNVITI